MDDSKKRKRTFESDPSAPLRGFGFISGIHALAQGGDTPVLGALSIPYDEKYTTKYIKKGWDPVTVNSSKNVEEHGTFGLTAHRDGKGYWRQGLLTPMGNTSYFDEEKKVDKAIPSALTAKRAKVESRGMKFLSLSEVNYAPKKNDINVEVVEQKRSKKSPVLTKSDQDTGYWGSLTMGSFLEDITGSRSMGIDDVGSGMRAMTMAAKWRMKTGNSTSDVGFGDKMLNAFPQLGKMQLEKDIIPGLGTHQTGASALRQHVVGNDSAKRMAVIKHHIGLKGSVLSAHHEAETAAAEQFDAKLAKARLAAPNADLTSDLGGWWEEQRKSGTDFSGNTGDLRKEYVSRKLDRHGIEKYPDLSQLEAIKALKTTDRAEYTRQKRDFLKTNLKASPHLQEMEDRWLAKDRFKGKLETANSSSTVPTGKWWGDKQRGGTNFAALPSGDRKALQQEYADRRVNKVNAGRKFDDKLNAIQSGSLKASGWWDSKKNSGTDFKALSSSDHANLRKEYIAKKVS